MTLESFLWSIHSLHRTDLRSRLNTLQMPAAGIYGRGDKIVDPHQAHLFSSIANSRVVMLDDARHFPMLDDPEGFYAALSGFLNN